MTDIEWGPAIAVDGKRPGWLQDLQPIRGTYNHGRYPWVGDDTYLAKQFHWEHVASIRLPADHPHYLARFFERDDSVATPQPTPQADTKPDLTARMEALVRAMVRPNTMHWGGDYTEARAIVALLPEPVDPDTEEAERIAYEMQEALPRDLVEAGIKRGRALALAGEKEA